MTPTDDQPRRGGLRAPAAALAALVTAAALAAAGCAGIGPGSSGPGGPALPPPPPKPKASVQKPSTGETELAKVVALIAAATPSSLSDAGPAAAAARAAGSTDADAAAAAAQALLRGLYPGGAGAGAAAAGGMPADAATRDPYLQRIVPALGLLDPGAPLDPAEAADLARGLEEAAALRTDSPLASYLAGVLLLKQAGPGAKARSAFEEALRRAPAFSPAAAELLDLVISSGSAAKELPLLQHLASLAPTAAERYEGLARADLAGGQPQAAADAAARGLMAAADAKGEEGAAQRVRFALLRAAALEAAGDWYQSLSILDALLKLEPGLAGAAVAKARILHEKAQNDPDALAVLADAQARSPGDASIPEMQARILLDAGRTEEALAALQQANGIDPSRVSVLTLLVSTLGRAGRWQEAASWLEKIPPAARGPEQSRLAWQVATALGDHEKALAEARQMFETDGTVESLALEARSMIAAGRPAEARVAVDHALRVMQPAAAQASELYYLRSQAGSDDPLRDLRSALRENPDNLEALRAIADALAGQKDYRKAAEYARRASALDPQDAGLAQKAAELARRAAAEPSGSPGAGSSSPE